MQGHKENNFIKHYAIIYHITGAHTVKLLTKDFAVELLSPLIISTPIYTILYGCHGLGLSGLLYICLKSF